MSRIDEGYQGQTAALEIAIEIGSRYNGYKHTIVTPSVA